MSQPNKYYHFASYSNTLHSHKFLVLVPAVALLGILALISVFFISADTASNSYATSVESEITAEIDGTHYVTLSALDVTFSIAPSSTAQLSKQNINVNVETNATGGADLYLAMSGSTNALHLNGDTTSTAPAIEATASPVAANSLAANTWGYSTDDQTYSAVPTSNSDPALLANVDGSTVGTTASDVITASVPVYFAAKVDTSIPAGSYSNRLTYSAVVDGGVITEATLTKITIDNAEVENMQPEVENTLLITTNLMTNTYGTPRVYYETTSPAGYQECGDVVVGRNESGYMTITCKVTPSQAATGVTLHIVPKGSSDDIFCQNGSYQPDTSNCEAGDWKWGSFVMEAPDIAEPLGTMQDFTGVMCFNMAEGQQMQLKDSRDGKTYWVGKMPDANCWMTQNLDLDLSTSKALTSSDTNLPDGVSWTPRANTRTDIGSYSSSDTNYSYDPSNASTGARAPDTSLDNGLSYDIGNVYYEDTSGTSQHYHAGNYYQWSAATAGYTGNSQSTQSICPKGWTLPSNSQFDALINSGLSSANFMNAPYYFLRGGWIDTKVLWSTGSSGYYWSSTPYNPGTSGSAYYLYFPSGSVGSGSINRYSGYSVRCMMHYIYQTGGSN